MYMHINIKNTCLGLGKMLAASQVNLIWLLRVLVCFVILQCKGGLCNYREYAFLLIGRCSPLLPVLMCYTCYYCEFICATLFTFAEMVSGKGEGAEAELGYHLYF